MADKTYLVEAFPQANQLLSLLPPGATVLGSGPSGRTLVGITTDETNAVPLEEAVESLGWNFLGEYTGPALVGRRDYGVRATDPLDPIPGAGDFYWSTASGTWRVYDGVAWSALSSETTESGELWPIPEIRTGADSARTAQTLFEGGSYIIRRRVTFNRIHVRITSRTGAPTLRFLLFQAPGGGSGVANRVATVTAFAVPAGGTNTVLTPTEGSVTLSGGLVYVLWGRDSAAASFGMQVYALQNMNLLTNNVPSGLHPLSWTTALASTSLPATFDPRATVGQAIPSSGVDVLPIFRLQQV